MNCHYIRDKKVGKVLIPGCIGTAVFGIDRCTCHNVGSKSIEERISNLEIEINSLKKELKKLNE